MEGFSNQQGALTKTLITFSGEPERQPEEWRIFKQLLISTLPDTDVVEVMTGDKLPPTTPGLEASPVARETFNRQVQEYGRLNGMLYGRSLMAVSNAPKGYGGPAVASVLVHGPVPPSPWGDGRAAFLALDEKYESVESFRPFQLQQQLGDVDMTREDRLDPARIINEIRQIRVGLEAVGQTVDSSNLAYTLFQALPREQYESFKTNYSQQVTDVRHFEFEDLATRASAFYNIQLRGPRDQCLEAASVPWQQASTEGPER